MDWKTETPPSIQLAHQTLTKLHHFKDAKKSFVGLLRIMVSGIPHIVYIVFLVRMFSLFSSILN